MSVILLTGRLLLAITLAVAGVGKLADPRWSQKAVINFGVPAAVAGLVRILLPLVELATAALLYSGPHRLVGRSQRPSPALRRSCWPSH